MAAATPTRNGAAGVRGDAPFSRPPGGFPPLSTRESGLPATKGKTTKTQTPPACRSAPCRLYGPGVREGQVPPLRSTGCPWVRVQGRATHGRPYGSYIQPHRPFTSLRLPISAPVPPASPRLPISAPVPPPPCGCRARRKEAMRRLCRRFLPLQRKFKGIPCNRSRPAWQPLAQAAKEQQGSGGTRLFRVPPAAFRRFRRAKAASQQQKVQHTKRKHPPHAAQHHAGCAGLPAD